MLKNDYCNFTLWHFITGSASLGCHLWLLRPPCVSILDVPTGWKSSGTCVLEYQFKFSLLFLTALDNSFRCTRTDAKVAERKISLCCYLVGQQMCCMAYLCLIQHKDSTNDAQAISDLLQVPYLLGKPWSMSPVDDISVFQSNDQGFSRITAGFLKISKSML